MRNNTMLGITYWNYNMVILIYDKWQYIGNNNLLK